MHSATDTDEHTDADTCETETATETDSETHVASVYSRERWKRIERKACLIRSRSSSNNFPQHFPDFHFPNSGSVAGEAYKIVENDSARHAHSLAAQGREVKNNLRQ